MSKEKKEKKKNKKNKNKNATSLLTNVTTMVKKKPVLFSLIGAGLGIAYATMGKGNRKAITDKVTSAIKGFGSSSSGGGNSSGNGSSGGAGNGKSQSTGQNQSGS